MEFMDYKQRSVTYQWGGQGDGQNKSIQVVRDGASLSLLDPSINVDYLKFYVTRATAGEAQPTVIITLKATDSNTGTDYNLETAVTPRNLNFSP